MKNETTTPLQSPEASTKDVLTEILRDGAREMLGKAIEAEVAAAGSNLRKLLGLLRLGRRRLFFALCDSLARLICPLIRGLRSLPRPHGGTIAPIR